jgi:CubicO group peptidase (beta-lactamase class C family)
MIRRLSGAVLVAMSLAATLLDASESGSIQLQSPGDKTTLQIHRIDKDTFQSEGLATLENWSAGWSFVRPFERGDRRFAFLIKSVSGDAEVRELYSNGTISPVIESYDLDHDFSSVEIYYPGGNPAVVLHKRQTGKVAIWRFNSDGTLGEKTCGTINTRLKHKDLVRPFVVNGDAYLFGLSRWTGQYAIVRVQGGCVGDGDEAPVDSGTWNPGWGQAELYRHDGRTYLILYRPEDLPNLDGGKVGVKRIRDDGKLESGWHQEPGDGFWSKGYSTFRVIQVPGAGNKLAIYKIHDGQMKILDLGASGIGNEVYSGNIGAGWTDVVSYAKFGELLRLQINEEGVPAFDYRRVQAFRQAIEVDYLGKVMGLQVGVMQSNRILYLKGYGMANRELDIEMTPFRKHSLASVSKMLTAVSLLAIVDRGDADLHDRMLEHMHLNGVIAGELEGTVPHPSLNDIRLSELLTYTARFGKYNTGKSLENPRDDDNCDDPLDASWTPNPNYRCPDKYQNSAFGNIGRIVASKAADELSFIIDSSDLEAIAKYDQYVKALWMDEIDLDDTSCLISDPVTGEFLETTAYYKTCDAGNMNNNCVGGFKPVAQEQGGFCSSGNYRSTANDLLYFLSAVRYGKVLSSNSTDYLNSKTLTNPSGSQNIFVAWNGSVGIAGTGERALRKLGSSSGVSVYVYQMPWNVDVVVLMNSGCSNCKPLGNSIEQAFEAAVAVDPP